MSSPGWPSQEKPPLEDAIRAHADSIARADAKRREDAITRALWPDVTDAERAYLARCLAEDIRAGRATLAGLLATFSPERVKAAEEANTITVDPPRRFDADEGEP